MGPWRERRAWLGLVAALVFAPTAFAEDGPVVFAAASLKNALDDIATDWRERGQPGPRIAYGASSALARQLAYGAPADLYISADTGWMDYVEHKHLIKADTRFNLLGNAIVLIAPRDATLSVDLKPGIDLIPALAGGRLAMANVDAVPAGKYGKAALQTLGAWETLKDKTAQAENVRAALLLVARGEARLGIVYATDAAADPRVRIVGTFPASSHPPVVYPAALTRSARSPDAGAFLSLLKSAMAQSAFEKQGFTVLQTSDRPT
jgi:molybdate transport system substrate-binding protein